jgi:mannose-6-phosphate isomerase-like protein (cupin superfamily)
MKPLVAKSWDVDFLSTAPPYERQRQVLFSSKIQGITSTAIGTVTIPPGGQSDAHVHERSDEFWISTKGHGKVIVDGSEVEIEPGIVVCAPAKSKHQIINTGKETLHAYWVVSPAGPEEDILKMMGKL